MRCTSVVIADRHPVVLQGLTSVLEAQNGFKIVACCSTGPSCIEAIRNLTPDIAIIDIEMPGLTGLGNRCHRQLRGAFNADRLFHRCR
jgi:two-component system nitrate/nitrite response regulator NarL